ncbi:MAG TPA: CHASE2 domain-containing protein, partial [Thermoanaerobaculia bacterium]
LVRGLRQAVLEAERARWKAREVPRRLAIAALLGASLAGLSLLLPWPPIPAAERWIGDLRLRTSPARQPDPRILLITLDEASLESSPRPLADRADEIGRGLSRIFAAGARGVAINLQLPAQWSRSRSFADLVLHHPEDLTLAAFSAPDGTLVKMDCLDALTKVALGPQRTADLFGFVNLDEDRDGVVRQGRLWFRDVDRFRRSSWVARAARGLGAASSSGDETPQRFWIDGRIDWQRYDPISWRQVPAVLDRNPGRFADRLVLLGGDFRGSGDDYYRVPQTAGRGTAVSGLTLQALMVDTIGAGLPIREPGKMPVLVAAALGAALAMTGILCARRTRLIAIGLAAAAGAYLALSLPIFWWTGLRLPITAPLLLVLLGSLAALVLRRNLSSPPEVSAS